MAKPNPSLPSVRAMMALEQLKQAPTGGYSAASVECMLGWIPGTGAAACHELVAAGTVTVRATRVGAVEMFEVRT